MVMAKPWVSLWIICLVLLFSNIAGATEGEDFLPAYQDPEPPGGINFFGMLIQIIIYLALVVGLFYLLARFLKSRWAGFASSKYLEVMDRLPLGVNKDVYIVRLGSQFLVIGVTGDSITLLQEVTAPDLVEALQREALRKPVFTEVLSRQGQGGFLSLEVLEAQLARGKAERREQGKGPEE